MVETVINLPEVVRRDIWSHLLPNTSHTEEAGFLLARHLQRQDEHVFEFLQWLPLHAQDYVSQQGDYLELTDAARAHVIKAAHDNDACLIEFHSHLGPYPALFSFADKAGFEVFVPHIWWRLDARPFVAVVVAASGFDALAWLSGPDKPVSLSRIQVGSKAHLPTRLTLNFWRNQHGCTI